MGVNALPSKRLRRKNGAFDPEKPRMTPLVPLLVASCCSGLLALLVSFVGIVIYITRYKLDFIFAIVALLHNVLITVGIFILGLVQGVEVDSLFIVALLTITGQRYCGDL